MMRAESLWDDPGIRKSILRGTMVAMVCVVSGGALIALGSGTAGLGLTMFLALPSATGFATALTARYWLATAISLLITTTVCLFGAVVLGLEGLVCVVMAVPLLLAGAMVGAGLGRLVARSFFAGHDHYSAWIAPLVAIASIAGAGSVEDRFGTSQRLERVESQIVVDEAPARVWEAIMAFDDVRGRKPLLMKMGLPVPQSCSIDGEGVGSERICHFDSGWIRERVTRWEPPYRLELRVEEVRLPGRHWLGFQEATYTLEPLEEGRTRVTRTTTITSTLRPGFYWRVFEQLGARTEHRYILNSLRDELARKAASRN